MATHIKYLVQDFVKRKQQECKQQKIIGEIVSKFLQKELRQHIYSKEISSNKIIFSSDSSGATYNLNLIKEKLLLEIQKKIPKIKKLIIQTSQK